jgi:hypothetical protein
MWRFTHGVCQKEKDRQMGRVAALLGAIAVHLPFGAPLRWLQPNYQLFEFIFGPLDFLLDRIDGGVYGPPVVGIRGNLRQLSAAEARAHAILDTINSPDPGAKIESAAELTKLAVEQLPSLAHRDNVGAVEVNKTSDPDREAVQLQCSKGADAKDLRA